MRVPRFSAWAQNLCGMQFSILGYGDIIVPGEIVGGRHGDAIIIELNRQHKYFKYRKPRLLVSGGKKNLMKIQETEHLLNSSFSFCNCCEK